MKRKWLIPVILVVVVGALVAVNLTRTNRSSSARGPEGPANAPVARTAPLQPRDLTQTVLAPGSVEASGQAEIRAPFTTKQVNLKVAIGEQVTAGQTVAELDAEDLQAQLPGQEAAVARAEAALAQLVKQRQLAPLQMEQKLVAARNQVVQAEQALEAATRQSATANQRLEQARASLTSMQTRSANIGQQVEATREQLVAAEAAYRNDPASASAREAYESARAAYEEALRKSTEEARQFVSDLAQAETAVKNAEQDLREAEGDDSPAVVQARGQLEAARLALEVARLEAEAGAVSAEQIRSAQIDLEAARTALASLKERLDGRVVKAPAAGVVLALGLKDGQPAQQGQVLMQIGSLDQLKVTARVDEIDVGKLERGQPLSIRAVALPQDRFEGQVTHIAAQVTTNGQSSFFEVLGQVANSDGKLKSGMNVEVHITTATRTGVLVVGMESVREENEQAFVPVVKDFKVELRPVKLGLRTQTQVEVLEGLSEGDQVIVAPFNLIRTVKNGDPVRIEAAETTQQGAPQGGNGR